jgi:hypothetical protein
MKRHLLAAAALAVVAFGANATTVSTNLGTVTGPFDTGTVNTSFVDSLDISYTFTLAATSDLTALAYGTPSSTVGGAYPNFYLSTVTTYGGTPGGVDLFKSGVATEIQPSIYGAGSTAFVFTGLSAGTYTLSFSAFTNTTTTNLITNTSSTSYGGKGIFSTQVVVSAVPEPETYAMILAGLGIVGFMARRRKVS